MFRIIFARYRIVAKIDADYCLEQAVSSGLNETRYIIFAPLGQVTGRRVGVQLLDHILRLDLTFHLERRTGALSRILDRAQRSVVNIFRAVGRIIY